MSRKLTASLLCDFYKVSHREQYPDKTEKVYSTWTPRATRLAGINYAVSAGQQLFIKEFLIDYFNENFFSLPKTEVVNQYTRMIKYALGVQNPDASHIAALHDLGYLPLSIKSLPEGTIVPLRVPIFTIENTDKRFFWVTNYIESLLSCELWQISNSATIANEFRKRLDHYCDVTGGDPTFVQFQGHDFSFRGMGGLYSAMKSGMGHLLSFSGTDTIPAIEGSEIYYNANIEKELVGTSIPATEHSVMSANGTEDEYSVFKRIITEIYPNGPISIVCDTVDFWNVVGNVLPRLKGEIMAREGHPILNKVVVRPDSGDPELIICGDPNASTEIERKGLVEALWDTFGGTITSKGFKSLDSHIGAIYGDAITLERATKISEQLIAKGFASTNVVYGIGSFTYQYNTRDSLGFAMKSTFAIVDGVDRQIFKDPKTDNGIKKSQKGRVAVVDKAGVLTLVDHLYSNDVIEGDLLEEIFRDGKLLVDDSLSNIRARLETYRNR